jgi:hypothetical protein
MSKIGDTAARMRRRNVSGTAARCKAVVHSKGVSVTGNKYEKVSVYFLFIGGTFEHHNITFFSGIPILPDSSHAAPGIFFLRIRSGSLEERISLQIVR